MLAGLPVAEVPDLVVAYPSMVAEYMEAEAQLEIGVIEPPLAGRQAVRDILEDAYLRIINGEDVQTVLDEAKALADEIFQLKGG